MRAEHLDELKTQINDAGAKTLQGSDLSGSL